MLNEFDLITHSFPNDIVIYPIADVHLGAMEHAELEWKSFLKQVEQEDAKIILGGDLLNNSVRSIGFSNPFNEVIRPREAKAMMVKYLEPLRDRILCVVTGNHERRTFRDDDQDLTYDICSKLDIEHLYRENIAFMCVSLGKRTDKRRRVNSPKVTYTFAVTHGNFGGFLTGGAVNKNERFGNIIDGLDCLVTGHVHKGFITKPSKIAIDSHNKCVSVKSYTVLSCVSWMNYGGYAAQKMLLPAQACEPQKIRLSSKKNDKKIITEW